MPAAPKKKPKLTNLSRAFTQLVVWLGPDDGSAPTAANRTEYLRPLKIERVGGGSRMNVATLDYDLGKDQEHILDTLTPTAINRQVEIREIDFQGKTKRILTWGKLAAQPVTIDGDKESLQWVVRIDKHHFGDPLGKIPFWTPISGGSVLELDRPLIFNPEIDEVITSNRSDKEWNARDAAYVFFDSAAVNTAAARTTHTQTPAKWSLFEAVHTLCWLCNPNETFIKNPNRADTLNQLGGVDASQERLKNLSLDSGKYLPELLDELLNPFGCSWTIDVEKDPTTDASVRRFRFFQRNEGTPRELQLQRPGEALDPVKSTVPQLAMTFDIANLANKIIGCTSRRQREATWELFKGWPVSEDNLTKDNLETNTSTAKAHPHAGHKWVLNESGAWTGLRPEITTFTSLTTILGSTTIPTCRKFKPCISRVSDGASSTLESRGIWVEWLPPGEVTWQKVKWSFSVLELECGIWFEEIPTALWDAVNDDPATARIRVTATIEGDTRTYATAVRDAQSPNADDITLRLNLSNKFHDRGVASSSIFASEVATADVANDLIPLQAYVETVRGLEDAAELNLSAVLEGIDHPEYHIGDIITKVNGRNLILNRNNATLGVVERYLQVMGISYTVAEGSQKMELLLESFDEEQAG